MNKCGVGVYLQASTLCSLEVLIELLRHSDICILLSGLLRSSTQELCREAGMMMLDKKKECAGVLAFDVNITYDAQRCTNEKSVRTFSANFYITCLNSSTHTLQS